MPKALTRASLLEEIEFEHTRLMELIERVPKSAMSASRVNSAGWSLKDVLAHIVDWAERCDSWCEAGRSCEVAVVPAPGFKWNETPRLNAAIYEKRRKHSLERVRSDFEAGHAALLRRVDELDDEDLLKVGKFAWCGPSWSVGKHIRANTAAHYRWATKHFKAWLRDDEVQSAKDLRRASRPAKRKDS